MRILRDSEDLRWTWKLWQDRGATLKFLDLNVQLDDTEGKKLASVLDEFGALDRYVHAERFRAGFQAKLRRGLVAGTAAPLGDAKVRMKHGMLSVPSRQDRTLMRANWMMRRYWGRCGRFPIPPLR